MSGTHGGANHHLAVRPPWLLPPSLPWLLFGLQQVAKAWPTPAQTVEAGLQMTDQQYNAAQCSTVQCSTGLAGPQAPMQPYCGPACTVAHVLHKKGRDLNSTLTVASMAHGIAAGTWCTGKDCAEAPASVMYHIGVLSDALRSSSLFLMAKLCPHSETTQE